MGKTIILEEHEFCKITVDEARLTPEFLAAIRADKNNLLGWKKHHKVLKKNGYNMEAIK